MSENPVSSVSTKKSLARLLAVGLPVLALLLIYGAGIILMPVTVLKNYQARDCARVLSLHKIYANMYPAFVEDNSLSPYVEECDSYLAATGTEQIGIAREAYDAYTAYLAAYPSGLYAKEAREHSGTALLSIANAQVEQKQYDAELVTLNQIVSAYAELPTATEAWTLIPTVYDASGTDLREAGNFEQAERVFIDFQGWAQSHQKSEHASHAQSELVQTYLKWGMSYLDQKQFEDALAKLQLAVAADPQSEFDSAIQVKATQGQIYINWGNDLLEQGDFEMAIQKFARAVSVADANDPDAADAVANGHIQWASDLQTKEDFRGALKELKIAQEKSITDGMKQLVETAFKETYLALSMSTGSQAKHAMNEALQTICEKHKKPDLPILGLNADSIQFGIYGTEPEQFASVAAETAGEVHFVACVKDEQRKLDRRGKYVYIKVPNGYQVIPIEVWYRIQIVWTITIRDSKTGEELATKVFEGGRPPQFSGKGASSDLLGPPPSIDTVIQWMQSVRK